MSETPDVLKKYLALLNKIIHKLWPAKRRRALSSAWKSLGLKWSAWVAGLSMWEIFTIFIALTVVAHTQVGQQFEHIASRRAVFNIRELLEKYPVIHPQLKLFFYDDESVAYTGKTQPDYTDWKQIFQALEKSSPKKILVDKLFDLPEDADIDTFVNETRKLKTPIHIGMFVTNTPIRGRKEFALDRPEYRFSNLLPPGESIDSYDWISPLNKSVYGTPDELKPAFDKIVHIVADTEGTVLPIMRIDREQMIPHMSMSLGQMRLQNGQLWLDEQRVPTNKNGEVVVNLINTTNIFARAYSMRALIKFARLGRTIPVVKPGDTVMIIPTMYTGHSDWIATPLGLVPGGQVLSSTINSAMTGTWIRYFEARLLMMCLVFAWMFGLYRFLPDVGFRLLGGLTCLAVPAGSIAAFVYLNLEITWMYPSILSVALFINISFQRFKRMRLDQVKVEQDSFIAKTVQETLLPQHQQLKGIDVSVFYESADDVGGDWYHYEVNNKGNLAFFCIADITGHGIPSALMTGVICGSLRTSFRDLVLAESLDEAPIESTIDKLNNVVYHTGRKAHRVLTFLFVGLDLQTGRVDLFNAGHIPPYLTSTKTGKAKRLPVKGELIGIRQEGEFGKKTYTIEDQDILMLCTDGLLENEGPNKEVMSTKELKEILAKSTDPKHMIDQLLTAGRAIWKTNPAEDDNTIMAIQWKQLQGGDLTSQDSDLAGLADPADTTKPTDQKSA